LLSLRRMKIVEQIKQPIAQEMELFEKKFRDSMLSKVALLNRITYYIVNRKGKQMRPMFVFLTAKMVSGGNVNERTYRGAAVIELIHTATLVHDDVVDDSNRRRGFFSVNALWKNKIAVLVGDYLLSKGLLLSIDYGDFDLLKIIGWISLKIFITKSSAKKLLHLLPPVAPSVPALSILKVMILRKCASLANL
jgi:octaprenyl-diphosphate synthase